MSDRKQKKAAPKKQIVEAKYGIKNKTKPKKVYVPGIELDLDKYTPHPDKKPYNNRSQFKSSYSKLDSECQQYIDQILDPDSVQETIRHPNTYGLSSTYKSVNILNANFDATGESIVIVYPKLSNSIFATAGGDFDFSVTQPDVAGAAAPNNMLVQQIEFGSNTTAQIDIKNPFFFEASHAALPVPHVDSGSVHYLYPISARELGAGLTYPIVNFTFDELPLGNFVGAITCAVKLWSASFGLLETITPAGVIGASNDVNMRCANATSQAYYMSFRIQYNGNHGYQGNVVMNIRNNPNSGNVSFLLRLPHTFTHCLVSDLTGAKQISTTSEKFFVSALSLLCSWKGAMISNSGMITSAKIPKGTNCICDKADTSIGSTTGQSSYFSWISTLPNNRMDGPIKDGSYSWYLGDDESDYFYKETEDQNLDLPYLVAAFNTAVATSANTVRIKVVAHVQFKSNSQLYSQAPSPYMKDSRSLPHILSLINSSYSNDGHKNGLAEQLKSIGKQVGKALVSPKTWHTVAELMAMLAL